MQKSYHVSASTYNDEQNTVTPGSLIQLYKGSGFITDLSRVYLSIANHDIQCLVFDSSYQHLDTNKHRKITQFGQTSYILFD